MAGRNLIFVLGTGRAGTSALTRVLSLCGCTLPELVLGGADYNPKGSWEPILTRKLTFEFMARHGAAGLDPSLRLQEMTFGEAEREDYINELQRFLVSCPPGPTLLIKELAVTDLWDLWSEAARRGGFLTKVVVPIRHPQEVIASFKVSNEWGSTFWLKRNLLAERHSRQVPRIFVEYANLLQDWRTEVTRISRALDLDLSANEAAIDDFLTKDLHRQKFAGPVVEVFPSSWMSRTYAILSRAARDLPVDSDALNTIYESFRLCERTFRASRDDYQRSLDSGATQQTRDELANEAVLRSGFDF